MTQSDDQKKGNAVGLLLVDVQQDYLKKKLNLPKDRLIENLEKLLRTFRELSQPVIHSQTLVQPDGSNRMPHQKELENWRCIKGTPGSLPPQTLAPKKGEKVFSKIFYSAFSNADVQSWLHKLNIDELVIGGLYTHACVRSTVLDAYEHGFKITVASDAVASENLLHAQLSKEWLGSRACTFKSVSEIVYDLNCKPDEKNPIEKRSNFTAKKFEVSYSFGKWNTSNRNNFWQQRNPSNWEEVLGHVPLGRGEDIEQAVKSAKDGESVWLETPLNERLEILSAWMNELKNREDEIVSLLAVEVGKPLKAGLAEFRFGLNLLKETIRRAEKENDGDIESGVAVRYRPLGTVALITPWNNPFAIPLGKIAPALAYGNTVVWKPALQSPRMASLFVETLETTSLPGSCLNIVMGDAATAQILARQEDIKSISVTGSISAGRDLADISSQFGKRLQAEMGGNNAVLIGRSANTSEIAKELVPAVYSFSGQRCTAPRRLIIAQENFEEFTEAFFNGMDDLKIGSPNQPETQIGPLISKSQQEQIVRLIEESKKEGARILKGGMIPQKFKNGCWYEPTLLTEVDPTAKIFQEESFGPVAVLCKFSDFNQGIDLCNAVPHGLSASLYSNDKKEIQIFLDRAEAGILRVNSKQAEFSSQAPFHGWKASGSGIAEHGRWDREFYTRLQTVYT